MHEDLVIELRAIESYGSTEISSYDAGLYADAIEGMNEIINGLNETIKMYGKDASCWVPVTEQLPEEAGKYLVCGRWRGKQTEIWVCEFMTLGCLKGWANNAANPCVSHWMPLPDPPKEET